MNYGVNRTIAAAIVPVITAFTYWANVHLAADPEYTAFLQNRDVLVA